MKNYLWIWRLLVVLLLVGSPAMGSAAKRKAIPQLPKGDMGKKKRDVEEAAGPASLRQFEQSQFDDRVKRLQKRKSVARQKQIQNLEKILRDNPYYEQKASVFHRLAERHWQEANYLFLLAMEVYGKKMDEFQANTLHIEPKEPLEDYSVALDYYRKIQREFGAQYPRIDEVTYYLAKGLLLEGENRKNPNLIREGVKNLKKVVKEYPQSVYVPESYLALGEYYFEHNMLFYAKNNYEAIINNFRKASMYNYALYKQAWVFYNLREYDKSISTFKAVIEQLGAHQASSIIEFREQGLNDLVRVYAEVEEGWQQARKYFITKMDEEKTYKRLRALGELLMGMDKDEEAISLYEHFLEKFPSHVEVITWWENILGIRVEQNLLSKIEEDTRRMVLFLGVKSSWTAANSGSKDLLDEAHETTERRLLWISTRFHQEAQRLKDASSYDRSIGLYRLFLKRFGQSKHAYRVNFFLAEILFEQKSDHKGALVQYENVLARDSKGEYTEDSALGAVFCYDELLVRSGIRERARGNKAVERVKLSDADLKKKQKEDFKETPLHPLEEGFVKSVDTYVTLVTAWLKANPELKKKNAERGANIPVMSFIAAQLLYSHGKYRDAVKRLQVVFEHFPKHKFAAYAVNVLIDCYARLRQWEKVENWAVKLIKAKNFKVKTKRQLDKIRAIAIGERARIMTLNKEYTDAVSENLRIVKEFKKIDKELAAIALFNVAAIYERARDIPKAIKTYEQVRKQFPKASISPQAQFTIGLIYESQTQFAKAAQAFSKMDAFKEDPQTPDAIQNAGFIYEALDKTPQAIKEYRRYLKLFPKRKDVPVLEFRICVLQEESGGKKNLAKAKKCFLAFTKKYKESLAMVVQAYSRVGRMAYEANAKRNRKDVLKRFGSALDAYGKLVESGAKKGIAKYYAAQAAFYSAEYLYTDFGKIALTKQIMKKIEMLKETITKKAESLQAADKAFNDIFAVYKEPQWNAAALFRIGLLYYEFRNMLLDAPVPERLPYEVQDAYRAHLETTAEPVEKKALTAFGFALRLAHEQRVYNRWSKKSGEYASKVNPDEFPIHSEDKVGHEHTKDTLSAASYIRILKRGDIAVDMIKGVEAKSGKGNK